MVQKALFIGPSVLNVLPNILKMVKLLKEQLKHGTLKTAFAIFVGHMFKIMVFYKQS